MTSETEPTEASKPHGRAKSGRAARQRRRKAREILQAEEALREGRDLSSSVVGAAVIPSDRSEVWPAVLDCRIKFHWSEDDEIALVGQLGYLPGNAISVCARASQLICLNDLVGSEPVVLKLYPIAVREECSGTGVGGRRKARKRTRQTKDIAENSDAFSDKHLIEPFPTMYWVTNPKLRILISKLELESFGVKIKEKLESGPESMESMKRAHKAYGKARKELLNDSDNALIAERKWDSAFSEDRVLQASRTILPSNNGASENVVGRWVMEEVENRLCDHAIAAQSG